MGQASSVKAAPCPRESSPNEVSADGTAAYPRGERNWMDDETLHRRRVLDPVAHHGRPIRGEDTNTDWGIEQLEDDPYWWHSGVENLCFDLHLTEAEDLTADAPVPSQWWDVQRLTESDYFMAVTKPAGMFVVTDNGGLWEVSPTNFVHVTHERFELESKYEPRQRGICHRLDSHTSGVQIFAKHYEGFQHFAEQNTAHRTQKEYVCLVHGRLGGGDDGTIGVIDVPLKKWQDFKNREFGSVICAHEGVPAVSKYRVLRHLRVPAAGSTEFWGEDRWFSLVQLRILTGRTHQIRVHMAFVGHPLVGDRKYNPAMWEQDCAISPRIFLHCMRMQFDDMDGGTFTANSDLALDLQVVLRRIIAFSRSAASKASASEKSDAQQPDAVNSTGREDRASAEKPIPLGFANLLKCSEEFAPVENDNLLAAKSSPLTQGQVKRLHHRCLNCRNAEYAICTRHRRSASLALAWQLATVDESEASESSHVQATTTDRTKTTGQQQLVWGPDGLQWLPSPLQSVASARGKCPAAGSAHGVASVEELGEDWGRHGSRWAWAHDGSRQNGWIQLHATGVLSSKWGIGSWQLLQLEAEAASALHRRSNDKVSVSPLLLVTFASVEHGLRMKVDDSGSASFEVVSKCRITSEASLASLTASGQLAVFSRLRHSATRGWPLPVPAEVGGA